MFTFKRNIKRAFFLLHGVVLSGALCILPGLSSSAHARTVGVMHAPSRHYHRQFSRHVQGKAVLPCFRNSPSKICYPRTWGSGYSRRVTSSYDRGFSSSRFRSSTSYYSRSFTGSARGWGYQNSRSYSTRRSSVSVGTKRSYGRNGPIHSSERIISYREYRNPQTTVGVTIRAR